MKLIHPCETIKEVMAEHNISVAKLTQKTGETLPYIHRLLTGQEDITASLARKLSSLLGADAEFWMNLQENYDKEVYERLI